MSVQLSSDVAPWPSSTRMNWSSGFTFLPSSASAARNALGGGRTADDGILKAGIAAQQRDVRGGNVGLPGEVIVKARVRSR